MADEIMKIIEVVKGGQLHVILVVLGLISIFLAITGGLAGKIEVPASRQKLLALFGVISFFCGIFILVYPATQDGSAGGGNGGGGGHSPPHEGLSVFKADFQSKDDFKEKFFNYAPGGLIDLGNGSLHLRCDSEDPRKGVSSRTKRRFDNNSIYHFRIKLEEKRFAMHPTAHINFLSSADLRTRFCLMIDETGLSNFTWIEGSEVGEKTFFPLEISKSVWHDVKAKLHNGTCEIFFNNSPNKICEFTLNEQLPSDGFFVFECHQEYWVDFLEIEELG
jgi:hypothetical protein